ncbi:ABC-F type ribosomal protection protein [Tetragenococcus koreensis]|uniref:ATPase component of ABC transporter with duplicated ATPase domains n=1 Tax=Tetragenococcus koreensis TaxID=290335 RepID=A0AAN4RJY8_9ENTE|nr:ABC-F type ribosomal protection protein [Tetragenococcus koreensis]AYW45575.1 ABC transporter ATP-binding protein [Tetragenococcus koreensis]MCF1617766.1 ABC-F type ribosomal protection protein [Tetragenococcus koreensis]MCF1619580.1 ABC-F type ribosomal protection protein [Tetragenococcus koreensis]MCF1622608.1 ABC-F type ribosomal protection protein [Tetragenococcus koreensis]MCF1657097.1 ABC-F type ribosomal protection protein [Tetragenococcus koreensis]
MEKLTVKLTNIQQNFGAKEILNIEELSVYENDRIGIIGGNGQGKSTLLKIIHGDLIPEGEVQRETEFNYYPQIAELDELFNIDSLDWELVSQFAIPKNNVQTLSGGEESKFRLAQLLSVYQMGLLLDEPTTHLDQESIKKLVEELRYYYGTLLFVSHDRYFLNQLANKIWEVQDGKVVEYEGNYDSYKQQKELEYIENERATENYLQEKKRLETAITKKKEQAEKASKVSNKKKQQNIRPDRLASSKQKDTVQKNMQKTAKSMEARLSKLQEVTPNEKQQEIAFPSPKSVEIHNKFPIRGENLHLVAGNKILLDKVDFQFSLGKKIAIVGENGIGKSTLLDYIVNNNEGIILSPKVVFSVYRQMDYKLFGDETILSFLMKHTEYPESLVRSILNNLNFAQFEVSKPLSGLSGGEATRLSIALLFARPSNVLVLDEPTNFIDLKTTEALEKLIAGYEGTVLLTSHDPYFVEKVADEVYEFKEQQLRMISKEEI